ncbi:MAG: signal peptidase I [Gammaproteobacteria bacterium]|nr:signal peptidase I [Gammaproteobacteria bacterium]
MVLITRSSRFWRSTLIFVTAIVLVRASIADWNRVPTGSMMPTILPGDRIAVDKLAYDLRLPFTLKRLVRWSDPSRSDIITFESPKDRGLVVKRVIGIPGDRVQLVNDALWVNGEPAGYTPAAGVQPTDHAGELNIERIETVLGTTRTILQATTSSPPFPGAFPAVQVPNQHYLVLGDNRGNSQDYRTFGFVHRSTITGRAYAVLFSLNYDNRYLPRANRFFRSLL